MTTSRLQISGIWSGWYTYEPISITVPFTAWLFEAQGSVTGTTIEPNTFADPSLKDLSAEMTGLVGEASVHLTKTYDPLPGFHSTPISYYGLISEDQQTIEGMWQADIENRSVSGHYQLNRVSNLAALSRQDGAQTGRDRQLPF